jgi:REP element-mobilizing transposase RayT
MGHTYTSLIYHVVFSTKSRAPMITPDLSMRLFPYIFGIVRQFGVPIIVNGTADHVHLLVSLRPAISISELVRVVKTNSCRWVHEQYPERRRFGWESGYSAFSVSGSKAAHVREYIASQQERHRRISFREEFASLLRKHGLATHGGEGLEEQTSASYATGGAD